MHVAPGVGTVGTDENPDQRRKEEADAEAALHEATALAARAVGPQLGSDRGARRPFGPHPDADQETQQHEGEQVPRNRAEPGQERIRKDRKDHRSFATDVIGEDPADHAADAPAEQRDAADYTGI